ncbi:hypothetical protein AAFF_G00305380 [Aldrovandia affinis]|uniref:Uncharacterized protein n=1 Tax=Aldrovandia affinis TaxID=143900 RepID=A0AAD7SP66_9TELE|nr:hypothetical protein AAFF_G00305380 [Aldrovandia affinis]
MSRRHLPVSLRCVRLHLGSAARDGCQSSLGRGSNVASFLMIMSPKKEIVQTKPIRLLWEGSRAALRFHGPRYWRRQRGPAVQEAVPFAGRPLPSPPAPLLSEDGSPGPRGRGTLCVLGITSRSGAVLSFLFPVSLVIALALTAPAIHGAVSGLISTSTGVARTRPGPPLLKAREHTIATVLTGPHLLCLHSVRGPLRHTG